MQVSTETIDQIEAYVSARNGIADHSSYSKPGKHLKVILACANQHYWTPNILQMMKRNGWCPTCSGGGQLTIEEMQQIAQKKGGQCLSTEYIHCRDDLMWKCSLPEHESWEASGNSVKFGSWCPQCGRFPMSIGERITRAVLVEAFPDHGPFNSTRSALGDRRLELDCYSESLKFAAEFQGEQHYDPANFYRKSEAAFLAQKERDHDKRIRCHQFGIMLLEVPYFIANYDLRSWIRKELATETFSSLVPMAPTQLPDDEFYKRVFTDNKILLAGHDKLMEVAAKKGFQVLICPIANRCTDSIHLLCKNGHEYSTTRKNLCRVQSDHNKLCHGCKDARKLAVKFASKKCILPEKDEMACQELVRQETEIMRNKRNHSSCGFRYVACRRERTSANKTKLHVTIMCLLCGTLDEREKGNFVNPDKMRSCKNPDCESTKIHSGGRTAPDTKGLDFILWQQKHGIESVAGELPNREDLFEWCCTKSQHIFLDKRKNIDNRIAEGSPICLICPVVELSATFGLELMPLDVYEHDINSERKYKCTKCSCEIELGRIKMLNRVPGDPDIHRCITK